MEEYIHHLVNNLVLKCLMPRDNAQKMQASKFQASEQERREKEDSEGKSASMPLNIFRTLYVLRVT